MAVMGTDREPDTAPCPFARLYVPYVASSAHPSLSVRRGLDRRGPQQHEALIRDVSYKGLFVAGARFDPRALGL